MEKRGVIEPGRTPDTEQCCGGGCKTGVQIKKAESGTVSEKQIRRLDDDFTKRASEAAQGSTGN